MTHLADNLARVRERMETAAARANRPLSDISLLAVTKGHPVEAILPMAGLGIAQIGENRVQELTGKYDALQGRFAIHFIGRLQTNKAKQAARMADFIHSVDSVKLASELDKACEPLGKTLDILLQVNTSNEPQKGGVTPEALPDLLASMAPFKRLHVRGLMTMAMLTDDETAIRKAFRCLRECRDQAVSGAPNLSHLSMGMSHDFEIAIEEGATLIRVGSALFTEG